MPWNCSICDTFLAGTFQLLLSHIRRVHGNDPNFHCVCGISGCTRTFKKYFSWRKHIHRDHRIINEEEQNQCHLEEGNNDVALLQNNDDEKNRIEALYLLKLPGGLPVAHVNG